MDSQTLSALDNILQGNTKFAGVGSGGLAASAGSATGDAEEVADELTVFPPDEGQKPVKRPRKSPTDRVLELAEKNFKAMQTAMGTMEPLEGSEGYDREARSYMDDVQPGVGPLQAAREAEQEEDVDQAGRVCVRPRLCRCKCAEETSCLNVYV